MNDSRYPWLILVPEISDICELTQLEWCDQTQLLREINIVSRVLQNKFRADKINVASLGNVVSQLHVHCIARYKADAAWPKPVWGQLTPQVYAADLLAIQKQKIITSVLSEIQSVQEVSFS